MLSLALDRRAVAVLLALFVVLLPAGAAQPAREKKSSSERIAPPSKERAVAASCAGTFYDLPGVLIRRQAGATGPGGWEKVKQGEPLHTTDTLMSLPGFSCLIHTPAVSLLLRRNF